MTASGGRSGALGRFRVLELGSTVAGPFCGRLLGDFGAEVVKVEDARGDTLRTIGKHAGGASLWAASLFRNKRMVSIDLRRPEGQRLVRELAAKCDVVVENFRPGQLEQWGLGDEALREVNPGVVLVRISGFGQSGPYSTRLGYGIIGEAVSGLRSINGDPDRPPARMATPLTDYITGLYAAFGACVALLGRQVSGRGQVVDASLCESAFSFMEPFVPAYDKLGYVPKRAGSRLPEAAPNNLYPTRDGEFIHICAFADNAFGRLARLMERADMLTDARFASGPARNAHLDELDEAIGPWVARHDLAEIEKRLLQAEVPATRIFNIADIFADPHYAARGMLASAPHDLLGSVRLAAPVPRLSATPGRVEHAGREIGVDTRAVLSELLGYDERRIADLQAAKIVHCA